MRRKSTTSWRRRPDAGRLAPNWSELIRFVTALREVEVYGATARCSVVPAEHAIRARPRPDGRARDPSLGPGDQRRHRPHVGGDVDHDHHRPRSEGRSCWPQAAAGAEERSGRRWSAPRARRFGEWSGPVARGRHVTVIEYWCSASASGLGGRPAASAEASASGLGEGARRAASAGGRQAVAVSASGLGERLAVSAGSRGLGEGAQRAAGGERWSIVEAPAAEQDGRL